MKKKYLSIFLALAILFSLSTGAFAANSKGITWVVSLDKTSVTNDVAQTVTLTIAPSSAVTLDAFDYIINYNGTPITIDSVTCDDSRISFSSSDISLSYSATQAKVLFTGAEDAENLTNVAAIGKAVFTIPAGTAAGTYSFSVSDINASEDYGTSWATKEQSNTVTLEVKEPDAAPGYSVAVPAEQSISMGGSTAVTVGISSGDATIYNSYYFELSYDSSKLEYVSATEGASVDSTTAGKLVVTGYGADKATSTPVTVNFKGVAVGDAEVTLTKANVDKAANAAVQDAAEATITNSKTTVHIGGYDVTLPAGTSGESTATPGADYTFSVTDTHYNYSFTATMGGNSTSVVDNENGTFTIKNVSGALVITLAEKTAKTYSVTLTGEGTLTDGSSATYLQDYHFSRGNDTGYTYEVSITIGGAAFTGYSVTGAAYTIPGASVTGDIAITVTKSGPIEPDTYTVTIEGNGAGDAELESATVTAGGNAVMTLSPADNYDYSVTATMGDEAVEPTVEDNVYTVSNVTGNVVFTVTKTPSSDTVVAVSKYLELDEGQTMWRIVVTGTLDAGKVFAYGETAMYYAEDADEYYWLVISDDTEENIKATAEAAVTIVTAEPVVVEFSGDVNGTALVDVNDAQFIWNIYNAYYKSFTECDMQKFLGADVNGDGAVNTEDAAAVIDMVLNPVTE